MNVKKKPTRRDLLRVVARLQDLVGHARLKYEDDRNRNGLEEGRDLLVEAFDLCVDARSFDPPEDV